MWTDLLVRHLTDDEKEELEKVGNMKAYKVLNIPNIIKGKRMYTETILNYLNCVGDRDRRIPINFIAMTVDQFESENNRDYLVRHWKQLAGVGCIQYSMMSIR